ncbi:MAG: hypothetical protein AAF519_20545 [Bacteroidota bacterium]
MRVPLRWLTASIALSDGGFNNWDWGEFGKNIAIGAISGASSFGVGEAFKVANGVQLTTSQKLLKAAVHAHVQASISDATGGDYLTSAASGFVGGVVGGQASKLGNVAVIGSSILLGGLTAEATGGEFWRGATISGIVAGANHVAHEIGANIAKKVRSNRHRPRPQRDIR